MVDLLVSPFSPFPVRFVVPLRYFLGCFLRPVGVPLRCLHGAVWVCVATPITPRAKARPELAQPFCASCLDNLS
jgi:hypothetical protein